MGSSKSYIIKLQLATALAAGGEGKLSQEIAEEVAKSRPEDTTVQAIGLPLIRAEVAVNSGNARKAVEVLSSATPYDKANTGILYARGMAYLKSGQASEASREFQKVLSLHAFAPTDLLVPMSQLGLGRAYALQGDTTKARTANQDFFALWKDADPDIPILKEAKAEYAKLQ